MPEHVPAPVGEAARDRAAERVAIDRDRPDVAARPAEPARRAAAAGAALVGVPAEVLRRAAEARRRQRVDLLPVVLADVADVQAPVRAVEGVAPRIPEAVGVDPPAGAELRGFDAQELAVAAAHVLRAAAGSQLPPPSPWPSVEPPFGPNASRPPLWLPGGLVDERSSLRERRPCRVRGVRPVAHDAGVAVDVRVVHVEEVVRGVLRVERDPEQAALAAAVDERADVEEERAGPALELVRPGPSCSTT